MIICFAHNSNVGWKGVTSSLLSRKPAPWSLLYLGRMGKNFICLRFFNFVSTWDWVSL